MQSGQAMAEFLIAMTLVMSVLLLGIAMLGKFNDVRNRTLMGSRYVAWERIVWTDGDAKKNLVSDSSTTEGWSSTYGTPALAASKLDSELKNEVMQRVITGDWSTLSGSDRKQIQLSNSLPAMWNDYGGQPLLTSAGDVAVATSVGTDPASSQTRSALVPFSTVATGTGGQYTSKLSLPTRTLQSGTVSISIAQDSDVLKRLWHKDNLLAAFSGLTFSDTNVLMSNTWVPDGSDKNKAVFSQAVPAANVVMVQPYGYLGLQKYAPEISTLEFGRSKQDVVPVTRLSR
ncbi:hypothetical protein R69927_03899 [Paraburkholderia domus]|uniref:Uncharacterized protein n=1 Tax=Paraburkholderia domus TaxID=2793075 RepID=A0A9N8MUP0_9BURK|nr:hypothetical protein [Paraburkholderia domus]CAE6763156.1 hypothetical protein R70006_03581 [Paraburkholderia domus]CAE6876389.1 hypothetical protein R69927_03899 [Paraburkholderia domus]CAE6882403.1 hypothetical protein R70199_02606 [Paraburkholderia domus]CAE6905909.1 hypothetical protein R70211_03590 [Paraburkholderia domus]CAE6906960.1 hypothetical protein R75471_03326 [Paraburkholderia domus]